MAAREMWVLNFYFCLSDIWKDDEIQDGDENYVKSRQKIKEEHYHNLQALHLWTVLSEVVTCFSHLNRH